MSAILVALGLAFTSQVMGGGGRYGNTPPASNQASDFGGLLAEEQTTLPPAANGATTPPAGGNPVVPATPPSTVSPLTPTPPPIAQPSTTATTPPPSAYQNPARPSGFGGGTPAYPSTPGTAPPVATAPVERRSASEPTELMKAILTRPSGSELAGTPTGLNEVVNGAGSRAEQTARIEAYWDLCSATADYYLGLIELQELANLQQQQPSMSAPLQQADKELKSRVATALRAARTSQMRLASMMGRSVTSNLPLPEDMPHCGEYITRYEEKFPNGSSPEAAELNALLPLRLAELEAEAAAITRSQQWVSMVASNRTSGSDGTGVLHALELLALHRRAFVQVARDYNRKITRYTEIATPGRLATGRLVAMLVRTNNATAVAQRQPEASRSMPRTDAPVRTDTPTTFAPNRPATPGTIQPLGGQESSTPAVEPAVNFQGDNNFVLPIER